MEITPKWYLCKGSFDTKDVKMLCVPQEKHGSVDLCIKEPESNWNYPVAKIKLHSQDLYVDFKATFDDAVKLGEEIARRWNESETKK